GLVRMSNNLSQFPGSYGEIWDRLDLILMGFHFMFSFNQADAVDMDSTIPRFERLVEKIAKAGAAYSDEEARAIVTFLLGILPSKGIKPSSGFVSFSNWFWDRNISSMPFKSLEGGKGLSDATTKRLDGFRERFLNVIENNSNLILTLIRSERNLQQRFPP